MDITAIICEYHLLHNGHLRQIAWIREQYPDTIVLALMSGSFVQRGEAAVYSVDLRAAAAVKEGVDLVLELPFPWSMSAGPYFATGSVRLLAALGVTRFCFGSENGEITALSKVADNLCAPIYQEKLAEALVSEKHRTTSAIRLGEQVYADCFGAGYPTTPNDILGVSYLVACRETAGAPTPVTLKREGHESATAARRALAQGDRDTLSAMLPPASLALCDRPFTKNADIGSAMLAWYRLADPKQLGACAEFTSGENHRLLGVAEQATDYDTLVAGMRQKRLTDARIRRMLWYGMLAVSESDLKKAPAYTVLLGAGPRGREALRYLKKNSALPILTKRADYKQYGAEVEAQFSLALRAQGLYDLIAPAGERGYLRNAPYLKNTENT